MLCFHGYVRLSIVFDLFSKNALFFCFSYMKNDSASPGNLKNKVTLNPFFVFHMRFNRMLFHVIFYDIVVVLFFFIFQDYITLLNYWDTVVVFAVPFTTIAVLNTFTGCTVWKFATVRRTLTMQKV